MTTSFGSTPVLDDSVRVEGTTVRILDRRVFPETVSWVTARDAEQVAEAIRSMVTQSSGPLFAAYAGLEITALQVAGLAPDAALARLREAGAALAGARPTNGHPREAVAHVLAAAAAAAGGAPGGGVAADGAVGGGAAGAAEGGVAGGAASAAARGTTGGGASDGAGRGAAGPGGAEPSVAGAGASARTTFAIVDAAVEAARAGAQLYRQRSRRLGDETVALVPDGARILTHCWMDTYLIELVRAARDAGRHYEWVATETRPYLQGARLTAHTLAEFGEPVTLISDGMGAAALAPGSSLGTIDALVTAADRVSLDGSVVNKVGTLGLAVAASAFEVPFYALVQAPDAGAPTAADIVVEERDPEEVLHTLGRRTASPLVTRAWYPAFDVTPARFVTRIVTDRGSFAPARVGEEYAAAGAVPGVGVAVAAGAVQASAAPTAVGSAS